MFLSEIFVMSPQQRDACREAAEARAETCIEDAARTVFDIDADVSAIIEHSNEIDAETVQMNTAVHILVVFAAKTIACLQRTVAVKV